MILSFFAVGLHPVARLLCLMGIVNGRYRYIQDLIQIESKGAPLPPPGYSRGPSPLNITVMSAYLHSYPDQQFAGYIYRGLQYGFHIGFDHSSPLRTTPRNHPSSRENPAVITAYIRDELRAGRLVGPLGQSLLSGVQTNPVGLVPKSHGSKWRMIVDLSSPRGLSVNDGISPHMCSLQYASIDDAVQVIMQLGQFTELVKMDLSNAYRIVPVHPDDQALLGISWHGSIYVDRALPFGLRSAPKIFNAIADLLAWALYQDGVHFVLHYLDDFLIFGPPGTGAAGQAKEIAMTTFGRLGAPIAPHKTEGPSTSLTFLGIQINTVTFQLSLPYSKILRLQQLLGIWTSKRSCTRKELESLLGHLAHAATVIRPGRIFLRHLFSLLSVASKPSFFVRLNSVARADLLWWHCLIDHWNGLSFFPPASPSSHVYSDASGTFGCGAVNQVMGLWFQLQWPLSWAEVGIAAKELLPIVLAAAMWGRHWAGQHISFHCDNEAVVSVIQKRYAKHHLLTHLLRCLFFYASYFNFHYSATHIPGSLNIAADAISRNNISLLSSVLPQVNRVVIPQALLEFLVINTPDWGSASWTALFVHSLPKESPPQPQPATSQGSAGI